MAGLAKKVKLRMKLSRLNDELKYVKKQMLKNRKDYADGILYDEITAEIISIKRQLEKL
jgi:hypothetical protein